jgi:alkylation response protein AidB-like acyl-CoA dehydrogenase
METSKMDGAKTFLDTIENLGLRFAKTAEAHDAEDSFVADNFKALKEERVFSALVPADLGGGGVTHGVMCRALRNLARHCPSTALSLSMHQHLVGFQTWNHLHGKPGRKVLEMVAQKQMVLVSTGANDWLASSGRMEKADNGYRLNARKAFASGSPMGDLLMTSAPYLDPVAGWQVLHFPVPFSSAGLSVLPDWKTMGMRGTGSNSISLENVFIPEESVGLRRPRGTFHPAFAAITTIACPLIVSVYVGAAEEAARIAREQARRRGPDPVLPYLLGEMENRLVTAQLALESMILLANDLDFAPTTELSNSILIRKTLAVNAALATAEKALECMSGTGFYRSSRLERLLRDLHAGQFHPLPEKKQHLFTGRLALGLDPVEAEAFPESLARAEPAHA